MARAVPQRGIVGRALFASSALTVLLAILIATGVVPIDESVRSILVGVLALVSVVDVLIGWRFLMASSE